MEKLIEDVLKDYDFVEAVDFDGVIPATMEALGEGKTIGKSDVNVHLHGCEALGSDCLEIISPEEISECQALADKMEIPLRVRAKEN